MNLLLERESTNPAICTLGLLTLPGLVLCTIERPWIPARDLNDRGGKKNESCVPPGYYRLVPHNSAKHPDTWALVNHGLDVVHYEGDDGDPDADRATCLIHAANFASQLHGCIAPGLSHVKHATEGYMVTNSRKAMDKLRAVMVRHAEHTLEIR
jgi:hypothetical protein